MPLRARLVINPTGDEGGWWILVIHLSSLPLELNGSYIVKRQTGVIQDISKWNCANLPLEAWYVRTVRKVGFSRFLVALGVVIDLSTVNV